jgi:flavin-dependent dehydrogenase
LRFKGPCRARDTSSRTTTRRTNTDVAIIGAGPAGAAAALALRRLGHDVTLISAEAPEGIRIGESVPPAVRLVLADLGVIINGHLESLGTASAWGAPHLTYRDYLFDGLGNGWHLDRARFDRALTDAAVAAGAVLLRQRYITANRSSQHWSIFCQYSHAAAVRELTASFVIDATGRRSAFAIGQGARRRAADRLVGVAATIPHDSPGSSHTLIEAMQHGWWYATALPNHRLLIALLSDADIIRHHGWTSPQNWVNQLRRTRHISALAPTITIEGALTVRAANSQLLTPHTGPGWIAIGDAQMAMDPLSSAGILTALRSGLDAAQTITSGELNDNEARHDHNQRTQHKFSIYLQHREYFYRLEHRWDTTFWKRRHQPATPSGNAVQN